VIARSTPAKQARESRAVVGEPKTETGKRTLPLTPDLARVLGRAKRRQAAERLEAGTACEGSGYVVCDQLGGPLHPETVSDYWDQLVAAAGVRRIRLHDARHTCGTLMHLQGVLIAAWLGHTDGSFTMRTYVHSQSDALRAAAQTLGSVTGL
jgi:integrase